VSHKLHADQGRSSTDLAVFFTLQLIMFFEGIRSEQKLDETGSVYPIRTSSTKRGCVHTA
jgi:hypothetical protein